MRQGVPSARVLAIVRVCLHLLCLAPAVILVAAVLRRELGPDPVAELTHETGRWALRALVVTLAITPLRRFTGLSWLTGYRRLFGLYAFAYASAHLGIYVFLDLGRYWAQLLEDLAKRPFVIAGALAWLSMLPLAATSTRAAMRALGRQWGRLHRLVYVAGIAASLHFIWLVKVGKVPARVEPLVYVTLVAILLVARVAWSWREGRRARQSRQGRMA